MNEWGRAGLWQERRNLIIAAFVYFFAMWMVVFIVWSIPVIVQNEKERSAQMSIVFPHVSAETVDPTKTPRP